MSDKTVVSVSDFNLQKLSTKQFSSHLAASISMGSNIAVFGRRGSGKTAIAKEEIKKANCNEVYINLSVMERVDLGGYPDILSPGRNSRFIEVLLPTIYKPLFEGEKDAVILFDEVDKADQSLWAPLLEMVQFFSINSTVFPRLKSIIMTGNLISEGGFRPSLPLLDRAEKYLLEADLSSWFDWAGQSGRIHSSVLAYLNDNPSSFAGPVDPGDRYGDASPRGWERASQILFFGEKQGWDADLIQEKVCGCVGKEVGIQYAFYYKFYVELLPLISKIFSGENVEYEYNALEPSKKITTCMIVGNRFAAYLDSLQSKESSTEVFHHIGNFFNMVSHENFLISYRSTITLKRMLEFSLEKIPVWKAAFSKVVKSINC